MEIKSVQENAKDNRELRRLVAIKLGKMPSEAITDDEFNKITEIALSARLMNGNPSGIDVSAVRLFPNIKKLKLSNYRITKEAIEAIASLCCLEQLEIFGAEFDEGINFAQLEQTIKDLRFRNCLEINFDYPKVVSVWLDQTDIDFSKIDLKTVRAITIRNGQIRNACDLTDFPDIESVNLDGSTLTGKDKEKIKDIKVGPKTQYSHESIIELLNERRKD